MTEAVRLNQWGQDKATPHVQGAEDIASRRQTQGEAELLSKSSTTSQKELRETSLMLSAGTLALYPPLKAGH